MSAVKTRPNPTKKRILCVINEHFEEGFNTLWPSAIVFQPPVERRREDAAPPNVDRIIAQAHTLLES
ncbi:MAG: hypothetical protein PVG19_11320 [Desulfobacterales bacterium]|jgi:hypothetical protein